MKDIIFKGCGTALATPFNKNNNVNYDAFGKMIEFQIKNKVDSLIVCGTTGESSTLSIEEKKEIIKFCVKKVNNRVPVIAGTGSNNTKTAIELTMYAEEVGASASLIVTPYYNKTTQMGLIVHYKSIASKTKLPIILYNVPSRTGMNIDPETYFELSKISNIVAIKEASSNINQIAKIRSLCGNNLNIYSGNDGEIVPTLSLGGIGVISVLSNIMPEYIHNLCNDFFKGNLLDSYQKQITAIPLIDALFSETNPAPIKYALNYLGFDFGPVRMPLIEITEEHKQLIRQHIRILVNN